jgi:hypothetical protein
VNPLYPEALFFQGGVSQAGNFILILVDDEQEATTEKISDVITRFVGQEPQKSSTKK